MFRLKYVYRRVTFGAALFGALFGALLVAQATAPYAAASPSATATVASGPRTWNVSVGATTHTHAVEGMVFLPGAITIDEGDTIVWRAGSADIHTIVFPGAGGQISPYNPGTYRPTSNTSYDGSTFTASPVLTVLPDTAGVPVTGVSYALKFTKSGTYTYNCTVHAGMRGAVIVQPAGAAYPHSQEYYDHQTRIQRAHLITEGYSLYAQAQRMANNHLVIVSIGNDHVAVMRFVRQTITIHVGESVTFTNMSMDPHTVTFGAEPSDPLAINFPYGDSRHFDGSAPLNSGLMGFIAPATFTVTFTQAGSYTYFCALHDYMGMVGTVVVLPPEDE